MSRPQEPRAAQRSHSSASSIPSARFSSKRSRKNSFGSLASLPSPFWATSKLTELVNVGSVKKHCDMRKPPVACPLRWDELNGLKPAAPYTVKTLPARLKAMRRDPWEGYSSTRQSITAKARKALGVD